MQEQNILHFKYYSKNRNINFYFRYLSIKKPSCKCVRHKKHRYRSYKHGCKRGYKHGYNKHGYKI